jgi:cell division transport system ATP-binding protein
MTEEADPIVTLTNAKVFQQEYLVLNNVNLTIQPGEFVYLVGKTGSGKSSLLKTLYGALPLYRGQGAVAGYDLRTLKAATIPKLRRRIGIVFQDFQLLTDRTVADNLQFVLEATGWRDRNGIGTKDFKMPFELSGGEQQRVVIARALLNSPAIILADEPTGNIDPETSSDIIRLLFEVQQKEGSAVLMATHDFRVMEDFPAKVLQVRKGKVYDLVSSDS